MSEINSVNIRPGVSILSLLPHLNYKPWYALAEFVDNSLQSSISRNRELKQISGNENFILQVDINLEVSNNQIIITDNAAGISSTEFERAFRPAAIPHDTTGLSEYGMGMKSAACWFAPRWIVRTSAFGENIERVVMFDLENIVNDSIEELSVIQNSVSQDAHYTEIRLEDVRAFPKTKTLPKIKEHLSSMYRVFLRNEQLKLFFDGEQLKYEDPNILVAASVDQPNGPKVTWKKDINIDLGSRKSAHGFVAIRMPASTKLAGLSLFRRNRLIVGSGEDTYRPSDIFGTSNSYEYQRIFGEIHLRGFNVSHTKDGVQWEEIEDEFLQELISLLSDAKMPLLRQARKYRTRKISPPPSQDSSDQNKSIDESESEQSRIGPMGTNITEPIETQPENADFVKDKKFKIEVDFRQEPWIIIVEPTRDNQISGWFAIKNRPSINDPPPRELTIAVSGQHPIMCQFSDHVSAEYISVLYIVATMSLAEVVAETLPKIYPDTLNRLCNEILNNFEGVNSVTYD